MRLRLSSLSVVRAMPLTIGDTNSSSLTACQLNAERTTPRTRSVTRRDSLSRDRFEGWAAMSSSKEVISERLSELIRRLPIFGLT